MPGGTYDKYGYNERGMYYVKNDAEPIGNAPDGRGLQAHRLEAERAVEPLSDAEIEAILARVEAATPGPWTAHETTPGGGCAGYGFVRTHECMGYVWCVGTYADAEHIASTRSDVPRMARELQALRAAAAEVCITRGLDREHTAALRALLDLLPQDTLRAVEEQRR